MAVVVGGLIYQNSDPGDGYGSAQQHPADTLGGMGEGIIFEVPGLKPPPRKPDPDRKEYREEQDLEAQLAQAWWARLAFYAALLSSIVTAVGIWFVRLTLNATREGIKVTASAAEAASKQAEAAIEANRLAGLAYASEQRPWVTFVGISLASDIEFTSDGRASFALQFRFQNSGRTPALHVIIETLAYSMGLHQTRKLSTSERDFANEVRARGYKFGNLVGPGRTVQQTINVSISKEEMDSIKQGELKLLMPVVVACIRYQATFGDEVFRDFRDGSDQ